MSSVLRSIKTTSLAARNTQLSQRNFSGSGIRLKALKNWSRPSISELTIPTQSWSVVFAKNQKRYNLHLLVGIGASTLSAVVFFSTVDLNPTPAFLKEVNPETVTPTKALQATGATGASSLPAYVKAAEEALKVVEEATEIVKETANVVKETIETVDEVVQEVKKIEDNTLEIIQDGKDIVREVTSLATDVKDVIKEGEEIVEQVKE